MQPPYVPTVPGFLRHIAAEYGELEALALGDDRLTYAGLEQRSARLADALLAEGLGKGSRVGLLMKNAPDFAVTLMAAARIGAVAVPLSTLYQAPELARVLRHADIDTLFTDARFLGHDYLSRLESALPGLARAGAPLRLEDAPYLRRVFVYGGHDRDWARSPEDLARHPDLAAVRQRGLLARVEQQVSPADLFFVIYTSGSSGVAKGVMHCHGSALRHSYRMANEYTVAGRGDRTVGSRPWFWIGGLSANLLYTLQVGGCLVILGREDPQRTIELIETDNISFVSGSPPQLATLRAAMDARQSPYRLRMLGQNTAGVCLQANARDPVRFVNERLQQRVPAASLNQDHSRFASYYGMSETLAAHTAWPHPHYLPEAKAPSSGRAISGTEHKLVDPHTGAVCAAGEAGELQVRGYTLMSGLYKQEREATFEPDGFYRSGDICTVDADGFVRVRGRIDDMVKISGANVSPLEVEQALNRVPGVRSSGVFALSRGSGRAGERSALKLVAGVLRIPGATLTEQAVIEHLKQRLSSFKVPRRVLFFDLQAVPHTGSGKIMKREFRQIVEQALDAESG